MNLFKENKQEIVSYKTLRILIGISGILLPLSLIIGTYKFTNCREIQYSISHYYYTNMGDILVGILFMSGSFLITYKGPKAIDTIASILAGICAILVAIFPTNCMVHLENHHNETACAIVCLEDIEWRDTLHYTSAICFFVILAFMALFLFTKPNPESTDEKMKRKRNNIYIVCGISIIVSLILVYFYFKGWIPKPFESFKPLFTFESTALVAFGISWLVKGGAFWFLNDRPKSKQA